MRSLILALLAAAVSLVLPGDASARPLRVVATTPDLAAIAAEVVGQHGEVTAMALPTQDPHFVDPKPSLALALSRADALLLVGLNLEVGWLPTLLTGARNPAVRPGGTGYIDCSTFIRPLEVPGADVDRSMGDVHPGGNPHYLLHPVNATLVATGVASRFSKLDPEHAGEFANNAADFSSRVSKAQAGWERRLSWIKGAPLIQYHRSMPYLQAWLGFELVADVEPKPGVPPSPSRVAKVLGEARAQDVKVILQEGYYPRTTSQLVADKAGARLVVLPGGTDFQGGQTWIQHMDQIVEALDAGEAEVTLALLLAGCTFSPGGGWVELASFELEAALEPGEARDLGGGAVLTDEAWEVQLQAFTVTLGQLRLEELQGAEGVSFDPADPPEGYGLCHGGHCHADDGSLVDYATIEAELAGDSARFVTALEAEVGGRLELLSGEVVDLGGGQQLPRISLRRVGADLEGVSLRAEATGPEGQAVTLDIELPLDAELSGAAELTIDEDLPPAVDLSVGWRPDGTLLDGLDLGALAVDEVVTMRGAEDPGAAALLDKLITTELDLSWAEPPAP